MVLSRVDERLEEISDLLNDIVTEDKNLISFKRLCINVATFQSDSSLDDGERNEFWRSFESLLEEKIY
jgi:biotin synthase-related radical SAM superfamily protein